MNVNDWIAHLCAIHHFHYVPFNTNKIEAKLNEVSTKITAATPSIPDELSLVPSKNITEAYIQRKKNKLMFYRLFNFIPRELTGNSKKNKGIFSGLWK